MQSLSERDFYIRVCGYASRPKGADTVAEGSNYTRHTAYETQNGRNSAHSASTKAQSQRGRDASASGRAYPPAYGERRPSGRSDADAPRVKTPRPDSGARAGAPRAAAYDAPKPKKKKKSPLKRAWKNFCKRLVYVQDAPMPTERAPQAAVAAPSTKSAKKPLTFRRLWKKTKKGFVAALKVAARGIYVGLRGVYNLLMGMPPRTLLIASSAFGLVMLTVIVLAFALPGKRSSADGAEILAAAASGEEQQAFDSGTVDPYANPVADPAAAAQSSEPTEDYSTTSAETPIAFTGEIKAGDDSAVIAQVQTRLMELGYMDSDEPTEHFGPLTQSALRSFQRHNGLDEDGICGQTTYDMLMSETAKVYVMQNGDEGEDVLGVQQRLYELGYIDNKANVQGVFGEKTEEAAKSFQHKNDLTSDGKVGSKTLEMLYGEDVVSNAYRLGDENQVIKDCQAALKRLGYITFKPDGHMGKVTVSAIKSFQQANGLTRDGCLGPATRDLLLSGEAQEMVLQVGDYGTSVKNMQKRLAELNYLSSANATGYFGEITEDAVKAFQKRAGLTQDGKAGAVTLTMMNSSSAKKSTTAPSKSKENSTGSSSSSSGSSGGSSSSGGSTAAASDKTGVEKIVALAESKIGCKYVRGAKGPNSFDCSGFVYWCIKNSGVSASYMTSIAWRTTDRYSKVSSMDSIQRGDIIVFSGSTADAGHVGIYLGGGQMIDASSSEGEVRKSSSVLKSGGYWESHFICAYRIF